MKKPLFALLLLISAAAFSQTTNQTSADLKDQNNNFYDNEPIFPLKTSQVEITGEIANPGLVDFSKLTKHSIIVKETSLNADGTNSFVGAYRYDGYSLFDILNDRIIKKVNAEVFNPIIDLYVEIENSDGERVLLSWGEIYYPNTLHNIIIATDVMRIVPSKTKELWTLPEECKLVVGADLLTERNITNPVKITVKSFNIDLAVNREIQPFYSPEIKLEIDGKKNRLTANAFERLNKQTLHTIFYGRGRGIHSTSAFTGYLLKDVLADKTEFNSTNLRNSIITICGVDGYRSVYTYSEVMNRNDQAEVLFVPAPEEKEGGAWKVFPSCDFFSDRAVRAVNAIYITKE